MKQIILNITIGSALLAMSLLHAETLEVEVYGMTCAFCVDSLQRRLSNLDGVESVNISLDDGLVRLHTDSPVTDFDTIKSAVLEAGFTPQEIRVIDHEQ